MSPQDPTGRTDGEPPEATLPPPRRAGAGDLGDVTLTSGPRMPGAARAFVFDWLDGRASAELLSDAQLLVTELVTNSFLYGEDRSDERVRLT